MWDSRSGPSSGSQQHAKNRKKILAIGLTTRNCLRERACDKNRARFCLTTLTVAKTTQRQCWMSPYWVRSTERTIFTGNSHSNLPETCLSTVTSTINLTRWSPSLSFENHNHVCSINEEVTRLQAYTKSFWIHDGYQCTKTALAWKLPQHMNNLWYRRQQNVRNWNTYETPSWQNPACSWRSTNELPVTLRQLSNQLNPLFASSLNSIVAKCKGKREWRQYW
jgi:hypothetical protein